jgi:hypothetical protein
MARKKMLDATRVRRNLCLELAEMVLDVIGTSPVSLEKIANVIDARLPLTYDEAEAAYQEESEFSRKARK